ncbi:MAG: hypothetical protein ABEJ56_07135 [Candidatus Nanohaloarchaea archaeon]
MKRKFEIHGTGIKVESGKEEFLEFLSDRFSYFRDSGAGVDVEVNVNFGEPGWDEKNFSKLANGVKTDGKEIMYQDGPLKLRAGIDGKVSIEAFLDPEMWKHYGRIAKKGYQSTWNEYYEYFLVRRAVQLPMMWKMQREGFYPVHASAVEKKGKAQVFAGSGGVGKTTLALYLAERGYKMLGDNFVFLKGGKLYPYPEMLRVTDFTLERVESLEKTGREVFGQEVVDVEDNMIGTEPVELESIFLMELGDFRHREVENGTDRLLSLADSVQEFHTHQYASLLSFITEEKLESREKIYEEAVEGCDIREVSYTNFEDVRELVD